MHFYKNASALDYSLRSERLCIPFSIVFNATPASKTNSNDLGDCLVLACEGQTAAAAAIDSGTNFTTPVDSTGIFGALVYNLGTVKKLLRYDVFGLSSGTATITAVGANSTGVTASGNIAVSIDWSGTLVTTSLSATLILDFIISKS